MTDRPTKISFGEMRDMGVRGILVYCADHQLQPLSLAISGDGWRTSCASLVMLPPLASPFGT
jgi:hypothetical protein